MSGNAFKKAYDLRHEAAKYVYDYDRIISFIDDSDDNGLRFCVEYNGYNNNVLLSYEDLFRADM